MNDAEKVREQPMTLRQQRDALLSTNQDLVGRLTAIRAQLQAAEERAEKAEARAETLQRGWRTERRCFESEVEQTKLLRARIQELEAALRDALSVVRDDSVSAGERLYDLDENLRRALAEDEA